MTTILEQERQRYNKIGHCWHGPNQPRFLSILERSTPLRLAFIKESVDKATFCTEQEACHGQTPLFGKWNRPGSSLVPRWMRKSEFNRTPPDDILHGKKVLDVGCGGGYLSEALAKSGAEVVGLDISETVIEANRERQQTHSDALVRNNVRYLMSDVDSLAHVDRKEPQNLIEIVLNWFGPTSTKEFVPEGGFDLIVASEVIEHVDRPRLFLGSIDRLLKPSGVMVLTAPNRTLLSRIAMIGVAESLLKVIPKGTHEWSRFIKPKEVKDFLDAREVKCSRSPLARSGEDDMCQPVHNRYQRLSEVGFFFIPGLDRWFKCNQFKGIGYMLSFKKSPAEHPKIGEVRAGCLRGTTI